MQKEKNPLIGLDFDGVLFNSAYEAFWIAENTALKFKNFKSFTFSEFMKFRKKIKSAKDFVKYYSNDDEKYQNEILTIYEQKFYATRLHFIDSYDDGDYVSKFFPTHDFFNQISSFMIEKPDLFCIISTRDSSSIKTALESHKIYLGKNIIGGEMFVQFNKKSKAFENKYGEQATLELFVDDFYSHCIDMLNVSKSSVQANWGYGEISNIALSSKKITKLIREICY
jgi:hypothetical protein